jgi:hypothetical protein
MIHRRWTIAAAFSVLLSSALIADEINVKSK